MTDDSRAWRLIPDAPLAERTTFGVPARAHWLAELYDATALPALLEEAVPAEQPLLVLGGGSNVLFTGDYPGIVLVMANRGIERLSESASGARLRVAAGENWDALVRWSLAQGYAGLENLILIPGSVGAAPMQNIGAYGVEVREFVHCVEALDRRSGRLERFDRAACGFAYRDSRFKRERERYIITAVELDLPRQRELCLDYAGVRQELASMGIVNPAPADVGAAVEALRRRKLPDPQKIGNAGSFFKNPVVEAATATALQRAHPDLPVFDLPDGRTKLSAAWLIEQCGFKGHRSGDAGVAEQHALVLVNHGKASGAQLHALAREIITAVHARFDVELEPEPLIVA